MTAALVIGVVTFAGTSLGLLWHIACLHADLDAARHRLRRERAYGRAEITRELADTRTVLSREQAHVQQLQDDLDDACLIITGYMEATQ